MNLYKGYVEAGDRIDIYDSYDDVIWRVHVCVHDAKMEGPCYFGASLRSGLSSVIN